MEDIRLEQNKNSPSKRERERERKKKKNEINSSKYKRRNNGRGASKEEDRRRVHVFFCGGGRYISIYPCFHDPSSPFIYNYTLVLLFLTGGGGGVEVGWRKDMEDSSSFILFFYKSERHEYTTNNFIHNWRGENAVGSNPLWAQPKKKRKKFYFLFLFFYYWIHFHFSFTQLNLSFGNYKMSLVFNLVIILIILLTPYSGWIICRCPPIGRHDQVGTTGALVGPVLFDVLCNILSGFVPSQ